MFHSFFCRGQQLNWEGFLRENKIIQNFILYLHNSIEIIICIGHSANVRTKVKHNIEHCMSVINC